MPGRDADRFALAERDLDQRRVLRDERSSRVRNDDLPALAIVTRENRVAFADPFDRAHPVRGRDERPGDEAIARAPLRGAQGSDVVRVGGALRIEARAEFLESDDG